jgi:hypothetical protein
MRQAIVTKFIPHTNTHGARISAKCAATRIFVPYYYGNKDPHAIAADTLARKLEWYGEWFAGGIPDGSGDCFVMREFKSDKERRAFRDKRRIIFRL